MDDLIGLADRLEGAIAREGLAWVTRVGVVRETASTQDFARVMAGGKPGLVVVAGRQTEGRGRLGRRWADTSHLGLAMTVALDAKSCAMDRLAIAGGVAVCAAVRRAVSERMRCAVGLKWPNDVVQRSAEGGPGRKIAGVLVEQMDGLSLVGIGVNVLQHDIDWPEDLRARVVSVGMLGGSCTRPELAERVMLELDRALGMPSERLAAEWTRSDLLVGKVHSFMHDGREHRGLVEAIEPSTHIQIRMADGAVVRLPAMSTSMVH